MVFTFNKEVGKHITQYQSDFIMSRIIKTTVPSHIGCMYLKAKGLIGYHQAPIPQLFLVMQGEGWVRGEDEQLVTVKSGDAVFWQTGEWHETGTETGMTALVIESETLDPSSSMPIREII